MRSNDNKIPFPSKGNQSPFDQFTTITSNFGTNTNAQQVSNESTVLGTTNKANESKNEFKIEGVQKSKV